MMNEAKWEELKQAEDMLARCYDAKWCGRGAGTILDSLLTATAQADGKNPKSSHLPAPLQVGFNYNPKCI